MNELQIFENPAFGKIRTLEIDGEPWMVGKDVAVALGYSQGKSPTNAIANHVDPEDKGVTEMMTPGGIQQITIINESGLYSLILSSKLPTAKEFKHWVTSEVLPAIRKRGAYGKPRALTPDDYLKAASIVASCKNERLPYVLHFLNQAGISTPAVQPPKAENRQEVVTILNRYPLDVAAIKTGICRTSLYYYRKGVRLPPENRQQTIIQILG